MVFPAKKVLRYIFALFFIVSLNFFLPRAMPGDPVINLLGEDFIAEKKQLRKFEKNWIEQPILVQYASY
jgi:peptide/nickel transport system permease protein